MMKIGRIIIYMHVSSLIIEGQAPLSEILGRPVAPLAPRFLLH